ncbi:hypothetical protein ONE63_006418 [Megalurothrips usitatus]|uniref:Cytochrome c1, heme protein, mitochondrial n=1 Tax=Megalurothrips usitatus TaxID=439358 RepID=A0AAV7XZP1_9NEOP|nr:hypothetical protein ONE63_006418 [Megalurothrips usitatus]
MAACMRRICGSGLLKSNPGIVLQQANKYSSSASWTRSQKALCTTAGVLAGGAAALWYTLDRSVQAADLILHPSEQAWPHNGLLSTFDHASLRRGYEVYKQVCAACHSMQYVRYRELIGVTHTEEEAKAEAAEVMVEDGPDDAGNMFKRPGKLADRFPSPYPNENAARAANNGAYPPDLSYITAARHGGEDYIFALLTGYCEAPAGVTLQEGQHYNPYFMGGAIGMAQAIYSEVCEFGDGTPPSASQIAKDVSAFLRWCAEPEHDQRKKTGFKALLMLSFFTAISIYWKKHSWSSLKSLKMLYVPRKKL